MTIMNIYLIVLITLLIYSALALISYWLSKENDNVLEIFGMGIIGWVLMLLFQIIKLISKYFRYRHKRSIFEDENGDRFYCKTEYANDFNWHYKMIKRYAPKDQWQDLVPFTKEQIKLAQRNCDRCKHDKDCTFDMWRVSLDKVRCKHDEFGTVTEFDKFERK